MNGRGEFQNRRRVFAKFINKSTSLLSAQTANIFWSRQRRLERTIGRSIRHTKIDSFSDLTPKFCIRNSVGYFFRIRSIVVILKIGTTLHAQIIEKIHNFLNTNTTN